MKIAIKGDRTQKDTLVSILREMKGFFPLPIGVPTDNSWYFLDDKGFVTIHWNRAFLEENGYKCMTIEEYLKRKEIENKRRKYWENMEPFNEPYEVPSLPQVDKEEWENFYIPHLIRCGAIPKKDLVVGQTYIGECRNASEAVWLGEQFEYQRYKFGYTFPEKINHFEDDDGYDLFVPIKLKEDDKKDDTKNETV